MAPDCCLSNHVDGGPFPGVGEAGEGASPDSFSSASTENSRLLVPSQESGSACFPCGGQWD